MVSKGGGGEYMKKTDQALANEAVAESTDIVPSDFLKDSVNAGTEEVNQSDLNTPTLRIIQKTSEIDLEDKKTGWFYRKDTGTQHESVDVHLVYVTTRITDNFAKTSQETQKIYYGFYKGTKEPFKLYIRGWSMQGHREFQSEVALIKGRYRMPMYSLTVRLTTKEVQGTQKDSGKAYTTSRLVFNIEKDDEGKPSCTMDLEYADFLYASIDKFKQVAMIGEEEESENDVKTNTPGNQEESSF